LPHPVVYLYFTISQSIWRNLEMVCVRDAPLILLSVSCVACLNTYSIAATCETVKRSRSPVWTRAKVIWQNAKSWQHKANDLQLHVLAESLS